MDTRIYVMTHKKIDAIPDDMYIPLHVGRAGKEDFGYVGDDTGDHISEKNAVWCELTGIYWLWKNVDCDNIGICHYRRYFTREEKLLDQPYVEETLEKHSIIVPNSSCVKEEKDVYDHYARRHAAKDLDICRETLLEKYPEYVGAFDVAMQTILVSIGNMWITRKTIFDRYCSWLFDILFEVEKRLDYSDYDAYQARVIGFLAERLFRVWLLMQNESVTEENMKLIEPSDFSNAKKRVDLMERYVRLKIHPMLQIYRGGRVLQEELPAASSVPDDFHGKIPVWICWWQGEREMPELIRLCVRSLKRNLPREQTTIRLITLENCMQYVTFTEAVIRKFNEGKISYTHLSDLLRAELLFRYGGMWIDATYYAAGPIDAGRLKEQIFTLRFCQPIFEADVTKGRWSGNLWYAPKGRKLFRFLMESLWYYWEVENELVDYFLIDYIIAAAVEEFADVREELEQCAYSNANVFYLHSVLNRRYDPDILQTMEREGTFYKLNRQAMYRTENMAGEKTVYGYLCGQ